MDNAVYIALSKQMVQFRKLNVHANNMANLNTPSFKQNVMMMTDWTVDNGNRQKISFAQDLRLFRNPTEGGMQYTGNELDAAIDGKAFFSVQGGAKGTLYTRNGNFKLDANGTVVTNDGYPVLAVGGGQINIPDEAREIKLSSTGAIMADGEEIAQLDMVYFNNEQKLERLSGTLYSDKGAGKAPASEYRVVQGFLESSNVQAIEELTELITTERRVSGTSNFIDTAYEIQRRAVGAWARQNNS